ALIANGARFVAARHECGAACAADAWARGTGRPGILSVHQGPGLTNAMTGITEAAKSRTPLLVLAADVASAAVRSNFRIDVAALAASVGAVAERLHSPATAAADAARAYRTAERERRTVVLAMPLDIQAAQCDPPVIRPVPPLDPPAPAPEAAVRLAAALGAAERPVFGAGRGGRVAQVDDDSSAIGGHRPVDIGVHGDVACTARAVLAALGGQARPGYRSGELRTRIAREVRWRDVPYEDQGRAGPDGLIDPRTL